MDSQIDLVPSRDLAPSDVATIRAMLWAAFDDPEHPDDAMTERDWEHALGGVHFLLRDRGALVAHASVVERRLWIGERPVRTGYVEAVATLVGRQGEGFGTRLMARVGEYIRERFEMGALGTGVQGFYERLGWVVWHGPTGVRTASGREATPDEDGYVMVLTTPALPDPNLEASLACEWRPGDVW